MTGGTIVDGCRIADEMWRRLGSGSIFSLVDEIDSVLDVRLCLGFLRGFELSALVYSSGGGSESDIGISGSGSNSVLHGKLSETLLLDGSNTDRVLNGILIIGDCNSGRLSSNCLIVLLLFLKLLQSKNLPYPLD